MNPTVLLVTTAALCLPLLSGCANPSHEADADGLRDRLAELPGVANVTLAYTEPVILDSGKLALRVQMAKDSETEQITDVVTTTYAAFADTHHGEEGDLDVTIGDDLVHLRSFEPDAAVGAVGEATSRALAVLPSGSVRADINTQEVSKTPHVFTTFAVSVAQPGRESVLKALAALEKAHGEIPDARWSVQSGGDSGWLISADKGFPGAEALTLFDRLGEGLPDAAAVLLYDDDFPTVQLPAGTSPEAASAVVGRHLRLLGGPTEAFYHVESGPELLAAITEGDCFFDTGVVGARLERDHKAGCTKVSHPEP